MSTIPRSRPALSACVAVLTLALSAPLAVKAEEQVIAEELVIAAEAPVPALAPVAGPSWDEASGYGSVEASRAMMALPAPSPTAEANPVLVAQLALQAGDLGSMQEEALVAVVAAGATWDETSGYGSVEASRAANALAAASAAVTTQVPSAVRWATVRAIAPGSSIEAMRVLAAQQALLSPDLGGLQEEVLAAIVAAAMTWDETSGYGAVEASRAEASVAASRATSPDSLPAALAAGTRTESAHLATVPLPGEDAVAARRTQR